jgi:hypothetical protein
MEKLRIASRRKSNELFSEGVAWKCGGIERLSDDMEWSCREQQRNGKAKQGGEKLSNGMEKPGGATERRRAAIS